MLDLCIDIMIEIESNINDAVRAVRAGTAHTSTHEWRLDLNSKGNNGKTNGPKSNKPNIQLDQISHYSQQQVFVVFFKGKKSDTYEYCHKWPNRLAMIRGERQQEINVQCQIIKIAYAPSTTIFAAFTFSLSIIAMQQIDRIT